MVNAEVHYNRSASIGRQVMRALAELDTRCVAAGGCREVMQAMRLTGIPCHAGHDPLSRYLTAVLALGPVYVGVDDVHVCTPGYMAVTVPLTQGARNFVLDFDLGLFPELVEGHADEEIAIAGQLPAHGAAVQIPDPEPVDGTERPHADG